MATTNKIYRLARGIYCFEVTDDPYYDQFVIDFHKWCFAYCYRNEDAITALKNTKHEIRRKNSCSYQHKRISNWISWSDVVDQPYADDLERMYQMYLFDSQLEGVINE